MGCGCGYGDKGKIYSNLKKGRKIYPNQFNIANSSTVVLANPVGAKPSESSQSNGDSQVSQAPAPSILRTDMESIPTMQEIKQDQLQIATSQHQETKKNWFARLFKKSKAKVF
ncbi:hypothetical protein [Bacillus mycoides]|uniref:hypothetical protein n=1 Tax=Bacillus mycoides TaxID=1405 RepID=UPI00273B8742|nr:hypothetical protein [Bacillus mycoides]